MTSPFPGMDPYLEGYLWPDFHHDLATAIKILLAPQISPKYVARIDLYTVEDTAPDQDVGIMYPDVEILKRKTKNPKTPLRSSSNVTVLTPATITISTVKPIEVRIPVVEIRDTENNQLVTAIEILSPVNKRKPGIKAYRKKREYLYESDVHLLEIDLLRRGSRAFVHPLVPQCHYLISLVRAESEKTQLWSFQIQDKLPVVPVPLKHPDKDVSIDLGKAAATVYDQSLYHLSIDYQTTPPPPVFTHQEIDWIQEITSK